MKSDLHLIKRNILSIWQEPNKLISTKGGFHSPVVTEDELLSQMKIQNLLTWVGLLDNSATDRGKPSVDVNLSDHDTLPKGVFTRKEITI